MEDVRSGKTTGKELPLVIYYLSEPKDVFRLVNEISKVLGRCRVSDLDRTVFRYAEVEDNQILLALSLEREDIGVREGITECLACDLESEVSKYTEGLNLFEMSNGLYAVDISEYLDNKEKLRDIFLTLLDASKDIYLDMSNSCERIAWNPDYIDGKYVLAQGIITSTRGREDDYKQFKDINIGLC